MVIVSTITEFGILAINENKNIIWEYNQESIRYYGLAICPKTGNFFVTTYDEIQEITRGGEIVWRYSSWETQGAHSLQLLKNGNLLMTSARLDCVLEVNKKEGVVWRWYAKDHFTPPSDYVPVETRWLHLNHAWRLDNGDTIIGTFYHLADNLPQTYQKENMPDGMITLVDKDGNVKWTWGQGITKNQHYILPYEDHFICCDSNGHRVIAFTPERGIIWEKNLGDLTQGLCIKPNGNILVTLTRLKQIVELDRDTREVIWEYQMPERICPPKGHYIYVPIYLEDWNIDFSPEDEAKIYEHLRTMGYVE